MHKLFFSEKYMCDTIMQSWICVWLILKLKQEPFKNKTKQLLLYLIFRASNKDGHFMFYVLPP